MYIPKISDVLFPIIYNTKISVLDFIVNRRDLHNVSYSPIYVNKYWKLRTTRIKKMPEKNNTNSFDYA